MFIGRIVRLTVFCAHSPKASSDFAHYVGVTVNNAALWDTKKIYVPFILSIGCDEIRAYLRKGLPPAQPVEPGENAEGPRKSASVRLRSEPGAGASDLLDRSGIWPAEKPSPVAARVFLMQ
jgi:hypothetical protein